MRKIDVKGQVLEVSEETASVFDFFNSRTDTIVIAEGFVDLIVKVFVVTYTKDVVDYYTTDKIARSNWTQHTATTFFKTCQQLNFLCDFEVENRHDGAVRDADGNVYLCAEWEFDTNSIFKLNGEIDKLYKTCRKHPNCGAMLFTYKVEDDFNAFAERVFAQWNSLLNKNENLSLYLLTALLKKNDIEKVSYFQGIRVLIFGNNTVDIWEDYRL